MTMEEKQQFLAGLHVGVIGINNPGHGPMTVPIWYDYTPGGEAWVITGSNSRKARLLNKGDRISLAAQTEGAPPMPGAAISATRSRCGLPRSDG